MQPKFNPPQGGYNAELLCPSCGGNFLNQERVEVFGLAEDDKHGVHISVENGKAVFDIGLEGNPSARRHGMVIHFSCEGCSAKPVFTIAQHKGNTHIDFKASNET